MQKNNCYYLSTRNCSAVVKKKKNRIPLLNNGHFCQRVIFGTYPTEKNYLLGYIPRWQDAFAGLLRF